MSPKLTFTEFTDRLYVALLEAEECSSRAGADVAEACLAAGLPVKDEWLVRFITEETRYGYGEGHTLNGYHFSLSSNGLLKAHEIRERLRKKSAWEKAVAIGPDWWTVGVSVLSLIVALIALVRTY